MRGPAHRRGRPAGDHPGRPVAAEPGARGHDDTIEDKTGLTPRELLAIAHDRGLDEPAVKAGAIIDWLKEDYGLGRGHAMAMVHVVKNGPTINEKHVGSTGTHRDESTELWLDGKSNRPA